MTPDYVIRSFNPEQCVDFYTRILGLKLYQSGSRRRLGQRVPEPVQQERSPEGGAIPVIAFKPGKGALFKINHRRIVLLQRPADRRSSAKAGTASVLRGGEMYFMARFPLKDICARLQESSSDIDGRFVQHTGAMQQLRMLELRDPDGNQLRLVELG
jgi:hypothetical protein